MKRGEVWWADLPAPIGRRPVLLLSRDRAYAVRTAITVAFITTTVRNIPVEVKLTIADGCRATAS
jgi:mRNA interferase MazF